MEDKDGDGWPDITLKNLIESFSLFTAIGFVASGLMNALRFWISWRLNYFEIAQPSDIVMSGFVYLGFAVVAAVVIFAIYRIYIFVRDWLRKNPITKETLGQRAAAIGKILKSAILVPALASAINLAASLLLTKPQVAPQDHSKPRGSGGSWNDRYSLELSEKSELYPTCGAEQILWMGSSSAVLRCKSRIIVAQLDKVLPLTQVEDGI